MSEKARGKLREGFKGPSANALGLHEDEDDGVLDDDLQKLLAGGLGGAGFVPTQEWVTSWQKACVSTSPYLRLLNPADCCCV